MGWVFELDVAHSDHPLLQNRMANIDILHITLLFASKNVKNDKLTILKPISMFY